MRFRSIYTLQFIPRVPERLSLPIEMVVEHTHFKIYTRDNNERINAEVESKVDPETLEIREGPEPLDGSKPSIGVHVPEAAMQSHFLRRMVHLLSFLLDTPIRHSHRLGEDVLIPESENDENRLQELPTNRIFQQILVRACPRSFNPLDLDNEKLGMLMENELGLDLYAHALLHQNALGSFREYWKTLESAFGTDGTELVNLLAEYEPAKQMRFTREELEELRILRGRSSHAQSSAGVEEHRFVLQETSRKETRLKCLVEQVILTKKTWGASTLDTKRIVRLSGFANRDGNLVIIKHE